MANANKIITLAGLAALTLAQPAGGRQVLDYEGLDRRGRPIAVLPSEPADPPKKVWEAKVEPASANIAESAYQTLFNYVMNEGECPVKDSCVVAGQRDGTQVYLRATYSEGHPILAIGSVKGETSKSGIYKSGTYDVTIKIGNHDGQMDALAKTHYVSGKVNEWSCTEAGKWAKTLDLVVDGLTQFAREDPLSASFKEPSRLMPQDRFASSLSLNLGSLDQIPSHSILSAPICPGQQSSNLYK